MGRIKILAIAVLAVAALSALTVASASAATPTWYECFKNKGVGKLEKGCTKEGGKGGYELKAGIGKGKALKGKGAPSGAATDLHVKTYLGDNQVVCEKTKSTGEIAPPNIEKNVVVTLSKCQALNSKVCSSPGAKKGEIKTFPLSGELGYIEESPVNVGVRLESEAEPGGKGPIAFFECEDLNVTVSGQVIGEQLKDVNAFSKETEVSYVPAERIGEHEFEGHKFKPTVNIVGWADEIESIEKMETPPHVLRATICGEYIENLLHTKCTPEAYAGLAHVELLKGENLEIKA